MVSGWSGWRGRNKGFLDGGGVGGDESGWWGPRMVVCVVGEW